MIDKYWCWNRWCWYWRHFMIIISSIDWYYRYTWLWMWWWRWCLDLVIIQFTQIIGGWLWSLLVSMATKSISNILIIIMAGLCCRGCGCCWWCWRSGRRLTTTIAVAHTDDYDDEDCECKSKDQIIDFFILAVQFCLLTTNLSLVCLSSSYSCVKLCMTDRFWFAIINSFECGLMYEANLFNYYSHNQ